MAIDWYLNVSPYYLTDCVDETEHPPNDVLRLDDEVTNIVFLRDIKNPPWIQGPVPPPEEPPEE